MTLTRLYFTVLCSFDSALRGCRYQGRLSEDLPHSNRTEPRFFVRSGEKISFVDRERSNSGHEISSGRRSQLLSS